MFGVFALFFLFTFIICENFKFRKLEGVKRKIKGKKRLYDTPVCHIKFVAIIVSAVCFFVYYCFGDSTLERSGGVLGLLPILVVYLTFGFVSFIDIKRIKSGWNEELLRSSVDTTIEEVL